MQPMAQKQHVKPVAARANSSRYDVQQSYESLFFERTDDQFDQASRNNRLAFEEAADRADGIEMLKRRLRAATRRHLATNDHATDGWNALFEAYDADGNGELDEDELRRAVRRDLQIPEHELSDPDLRRLFALIDADASGTISADELIDFMRWQSKPKTRGGHARALQAGQEAEVGYVVPFVAEYYVLKRMALREGSSLNSRKIGMVSAGEIVAVTRVDGNRLRCERLSFGVRPRSGWCSEFADGGSGEQLLEMLPRSEWGDSAYNDTAIAARVSALRSAERLMHVSRPTIEGASSPKRRTSTSTGDQLNAYWEQRDDETRTRTVGHSLLDSERSGKITARGVRASQSLVECRSGAEVDALLQLLEATPRWDWETALRGPQNPTSDVGSSRGSDRGGRNGRWEMAHPLAAQSPQRPRTRAAVPSAALSDKALAIAAQLEAIASSLRSAGVRSDLAQACEETKASALALAPKGLS